MTFEEQVAAALQYTLQQSADPLRGPPFGPAAAAIAQEVAPRVAAAIEVCERIAWGSTSEAQHDFAKERALAALRGGLDGR